MRCAGGSISGRGLHRTLTRLVDDWDAYRKQYPDKSSAVIAETNAETRALSFLMRERVLADGDGTRVTIQACRGRDPRARPEPLEIAPGDRLRIGAPHWEKQLFNGTALTVLEVKERPPLVRAARPGRGSGGAPTVGGSWSSTMTRSWTGTARCVSTTATR